MAIEIHRGSMQGIHPGTSVKASYFKDGKEYIIVGKIYKISIYDYTVDVVGYNKNDKVKKIKCYSFNVETPTRYNMVTTKIFGKINREIVKRVEYLRREELKRLGVSVEDKRSWKIW